MYVTMTLVILILRISICELAVNTEAHIRALHLRVSFVYTETIFEQKTEASSCASQISRFQETLGVNTDAY